MIFMHLRQGFPRLIFLFFASLFLLAAQGRGEEVTGEKRAKVAMRMIGHKILNCLGDDESRVLPIEKVDGQYKISFELAFAIDPEDVINITDEVLRETDLASTYLVEVVQCQTKEVVHSFISERSLNPYLTPCQGRGLPKDCYYISVDIFDDHTPDVKFKGVIFFVVPLFILIGFSAYYIQRKPSPNKNPDLILIGASQFDKKKRALTIGGQGIELSNKETELLSLLHAHINTVLERETILQHVWGDEGDYIGRTLDVFISKLRKKFKADASVKIENVRGVGYKLVVYMQG
jgi:DNA-binding winged helix-turn-helix (wHTH) protein